ncbi:MAG TPA: hypothetical protein VKR29_08630 [Candidatus Binataceae bacterium]|nr:hypothetical protein [Candidatus Binataceae bacterium]
MGESRTFIAASIMLLASIAMARTSAVAAGPNHFPNLPPGAPLPSGAQCADWVKSSPAGAEARSENSSANMTIPTADELAAFHARPLFSASAPASDFAAVDGNFTGTTDQILRWAACKWGIDEDLFRAQAWTESKWKQGAAGDERNDESKCHAGAWNGWNGSSCKQSYGILQVKVFDYNTWPEARDSTAFNADFRAAYHRACVNGDVHYLSERTPLPPYPPYPAFDPDAAAWGCIGNWFSGGWYDQGALHYIGEVKQDLAARPWTRLGGGF